MRTQFHVIGRKFYWSDVGSVTCILKLHLFRSSLLILDFKKKISLYSCIGFKFWSLIIYKGTFFNYLPSFNWIGVEQIVSHQFRRTINQGKIKDWACVTSVVAWTIQSVLCLCSCNLNLTKQFVLSKYNHTLYEKRNPQNFWNMSKWLRQ